MQQFNVVLADYETLRLPQVRAQKLNSVKFIEFIIHLYYDISGIFILSTYVGGKKKKNNILLQNDVGEREVGRYDTGDAGGVLVGLDFGQDK